MSRHRKPESMIEIYRGHILVACVLLGGLMAALAFPGGGS